MKRVIVAASTALVIFGGVAACGTSTSNDARGDDASAAAQEEGGTSEEEGTPATDDEWTTHGEDGDATAENAAEAPTLDVGETMHVKVSADEYVDGTPAGSADVTLVSLTEADETDYPDDGPIELDQNKAEEFVIATFKVENTGDGRFGLYPLSTAAEWNGKDGEYAAPGMSLLAATESGTEMVPFDSFISSDPLPAGGYTEGTTVVIVPGDQPGTLGFQDQAGIPLFNINTEGTK